MKFARGQLLHYWPLTVTLYRYISIDRSILLLLLLLLLPLLSYWPTWKTSTSAARKR